MLSKFHRITTAILRTARKLKYPIGSYTSMYKSEFPGKYSMLTCLCVNKTNKKINTIARILKNTFTENIIIYLRVETYRTTYPVHV